jgi:hypothetical protein
MLHVAVYVSPLMSVRTPRLIRAQNPPLVVGELVAADVEHSQIERPLKRTPLWVMPLSTARFPTLSAGDALHRELAAPARETAASAETNLRLAPSGYACRSRHIASKLNAYEG